MASAINTAMLDFGPLSVDGWLAGFGRPMS